MFDDDVVAKNDSLPPLKTMEGKVEAGSGTITYLYCSTGTTVKKFHYLAVGVSAGRTTVKCSIPQYWYCMHTVVQH